MFKERVSRLLPLLLLAALAAGFRFPWGSGLRIVAASAVMALVLFATRGWVLAPPARIVLDVGLGAIVYGLVASALFPALVRDVRRQVTRRRTRPGYP